MQTHHPIRNNDPRVIRMDRGNYTTCTIILKGAAVTSWMIEGAEQIFMSRTSNLDDYSKYRGGISLIFPHYESWIYGRHHGFARDLMWSLQSGPITDKNGDIQLTLFLTSNCFTKSSWNYDFEMHYSLILKSSELETKLVIVNPSPSTTFQFQFGQHWYVKVKDVTKVFFQGLKGLTYIDRENINPNIPFLLRTTDELTFKNGIKEQIDQVYFNTPNELNIISEEENKIIKIKKANMPDLNILVPGKKFIRKNNLELDECSHFVVTDFGQIYHKHVLPPKSRFVTTQTIEVVKIRKPPQKHGHFLDYFEDIC